jgi:hypothetical protein
MYLPNTMTSYTWFLYLGIAFFVIHLLLYGFGLNLSYFGLILIYIGWKKPVLSGWFRTLLWVFIVLDILGNIRVIREKLMGPKKIVKFDENVTEGAKNQKDE